MPGDSATSVSLVSPLESTNRILAFPPNALRMIAPPDDDSRMISVSARTTFASSGKGRKR